MMQRKYETKSMYRFSHIFEKYSVVLGIRPKEIDFFRFTLRSPIRSRLNSYFVVGALFYHKGPKIILYLESPAFMNTLLVLILTLPQLYDRRQEGYKGKRATEAGYWQMCTHL